MKLRVLENKEEQENILQNKSIWSGDQMGLKI